MRLFDYQPGSKEPVDVDDVKIACRLDDDVPGYQVEALIAAAREAAEQTTGKRYRQAVLRGEFQDWPAEDRLQLPIWQPVTFVVSYRSAADPTTWTVLPANTYRAGPLGNGAHVTLATGAAWPTLCPAEWGERVRVDVTVGTADASDVPEAVRLFIKATVAAHFDQPGALTQDNLQISPLHARLLDGERLWG